jgi:hypothetical protein
MTDSQTATGFWSSAGSVSTGQLVGLSRAGRCPPWNEWCPPGALAALRPDAAMRERFIAELPEIPLAYFEEPAPQVRDWPPPRCTYLQLSEAYDWAADESEQRGWLTHREDADHLVTLTQPAAVVTVLGRLVVAVAGQ